MTTLEEIMQKHITPEMREKSLADLPLICELSIKVGDLEGDVAEVGVFRGGSAKLLQNLFGDRQIWLFDTFSGNPNPSHMDGNKAGSGKSEESVVRKYHEQANTRICSGWFPATAKEIQLQYDIDTNTRWFRFRLDKEHKNTFIQNFQPVSLEEAKNIKPSAPRSAKWWFEGLIQAEPANDSALNADIYIRNDIKIPEKAYLAVSKTDDSIFLWIER